MRPGAAPNFECQPSRENTLVVGGAGAKWEQVPEHFFWESSGHSSSDPLDFLTPAEAADLPDLDFPVPDQNVIPEMVFENDELTGLDAHAMASAHATNIKEEARDGVPSRPATATLPPAGPPRAAHSQPPHSLPTPPGQAAAHACSMPLPAASSEPLEPAGSAPLIPIQSCIVAHARTGQVSLAAVKERRMKNTESARRSRARRADKLSILREQNEELIAFNERLVAENERLKHLVCLLESRAGVKTEIE